MRKEIKAPISEIFCSYQGEGLFAGEKQIFVRFSGCNLSCSYCDEPAAKEKGKLTAVKEVFDRILKLSSNCKTKSVSFTGGEPMMYADFVKILAKKLYRKKYRLRLETNASLPEKLNDIIAFFEHISADIKLPSQVGKDIFDKHREFIKKAEKKACIKVVLSKKTPVKEFQKAVSMIKKEFKNIPVFIQPESSNFFPKKNIGDYEKFLSKSDCLPNVRFLPQLHKIWGIK